MGWAYSSTHFFGLMSVNSVILIESFPAESAYHHCEKLLDRQQQIDCVFFYGEGVLNTHTPEWQMLAKKIKSYACVKSVEAHNVDVKNIEIAGLTTFFAAALNTEQLIQFKNNTTIITNHHHSKNKQKKILVTLESELSHEIQLGIDMILAASAFELDLSILFLNKGIKYLTEETNLQKQIKAWPWYDINNIFTNKTVKDETILPATYLTPEEISYLQQQQDILLSY